MDGSPKRRSVYLSAEVDAKLVEASEQYGAAPGVLARDALERGLRLAIEARRKARSQMRAGK